jgi:hypothetical protein
VAGHDAALGDDGHVDLGAEAMADRQRQLDAAGAAADDGNLDRMQRRRHAGADRLPAPGKDRDRLHRRRMPGGAGHRQRGRRADIDGDQVEAQRQAAGEDDFAAVAVEADGLGMHEPGAGEARQRRQVDMAFVEAVMAGDMARQHAGRGRLDLARDQGQAHARHRLHAEGLQHMHMRMPAADQDEVALDAGKRHQKSTFGVSGA